MTGEKLKKVVKMYRDRIDVAEMRFAPHRCEVRQKSHELSFRAHDEHLLFMCDEINKFVDEGRIEKAMRWYGFLQGVLWKLGLYTIQELGEHSMPDPTLPEAA